MDEKNFIDHRPLYFLFQQEGDRYFLDSMLQLSFQDWIWLELKKSGYRYIYLFDTGAGGICLTVLDTDSYDNYRKWRDPPMKNAEPRTLTGERAWSMVRSFNISPGRTDRTAYIFYIGSFTELFRSRTDGERDQLIRQMHLRGTRDSLILVGSVEMSAAEAALYSSRDSIFAYPEGRDISAEQCLCEPLHRWITGGAKGYLFDKLKENLGDACLEPGILNRERVRTIWRHVEFRKKCCWKDNRLEAYTDFVCDWLAGPETDEAWRREFCPLGQAGRSAAYRRTLTGRKLYDYLLGEGLAVTERWAEERKMRAAAADGSGQYGEQSDGAFTGPQERSHIVLTDLLPLWPKLDYPAWACAAASKNFTIRVTTEQEWNALKDALLKPGFGQLSREMTDHLAWLAELLRRAEETKDALTARRAANVTLWCGAHLYDEQDQRERWKELSAYLELSREWFAKAQSVHYYMDMDAGHQKLYVTDMNNMEIMLRRMDEKNIDISLNRSRGDGGSASAEDARRIVEAALNRR